MPYLIRISYLLINGVMTQVHLTENSLSPKILRIISLDSEFIIRMYIFDSLQNPYIDFLAHVVRAITVEKIK